ncbi:hypothetical protein [Gordonia aichiensis]|uniref:hypothetical protein n=1 Tax=Gordonia aichiensis TaxID=36820 RepID=UPI003263A4B2
MTDLVYVRDEWLKRAEVAQECAEELDLLAEELGSVVRANYFGRGCEEGGALYVLLRDTVGRGVQSLGGASVTADGLARVAFEAVNALEVADATATFGN